ncbi:uncharacterized protein AMSG_11660 [Thecamonas trahens ATCC 50062]|uniref:TRP C-terminal domain-containing protein n=1 Tax=Thecamonas trahens ATCC 50062 TaxID=461836 RepID=A0A0L0DS10_THETB|nr:hypothetical protein AMSG_11660 [Thecamonas trahens ATCC 50062]KNC54831.1 hypothetical protein AMSG_11660 [Thecamonas trahens ATCC 50062]|eukprot:XP_013761770.1 hypothetical protein AMSG_11660 [Thecamonas trahens ATCC 50062]
MVLSRTRALASDTPFRPDGLYVVEVEIFSDPRDAAPVTISRINADFKTETSLSFVSPSSNKTGYHKMAFRELGAAGAAPVPLASLLTYVEHQCYDEGFVWYGRQCQPCSNFKGAYCPGGARFWPRAGYWSPSETVPPTMCRLPAACPGAMGEDDKYPPRMDDDGVRMTMQCAKGYADEFCSTCEDEYYQEYGVCRACGSDASVKAEVALMLIVASVYFIVVLGSLFLFSAQTLVSVVSVLVAAQQMVIVCKVGLQQLSGSMTSPIFPTIVRVLSIINFEIEVVKPGCSVGALSFVSLYTGTVVIVVLAGFMFIAVVWVRTHSCLARSAHRATSVLNLPTLRNELSSSSSSSSSMVLDGNSSIYGSSIPHHEAFARSNARLVASLRSGTATSLNTTQLLQERLEDSRTVGRTPLSRKDIMRSRSKHAIMILFALSYLQLSLRTLEALNCIKVGDGSLRLVAEMRVTCYEGEHLRAAVLAWIILVGVCVAFPVWMCMTGIQMYRALRALNMVVIDVAMEAYGFLLHGLKPPFFWFRALQFVSTFAFVAETVFLGESGPRIFATIVNFTVTMLVVAILDPFIHELHTLLSIGSGLASSGQLMYYLYQEDETLFGISVGFQIVTIAVAVAAIVFHVSCSTTSPS